MMRPITRKIANLTIGGSLSPVYSLGTMGAYSVAVEIDNTGDNPLTGFSVFKKFHPNGDWWSWLETFGQGGVILESHGTELQHLGAAETSAVLIDVSSCFAIQLQAVSAAGTNISASLSLFF